MNSCSKSKSNAVFPPHISCAVTTAIAAICRVTVTVRSNELDRIGIALDFRKLKQELDSLLEEYDHRNLSELPEFQELNPTSEVLARTIYRRMGEKMNGGPIRVWKVRVGESDSSAVTYFED